MTEVKVKGLRLTGLRRALTAQRARMIALGEEAVQTATTAGAKALDGALEDAVTTTGLYRMLLHGGHAGRHDTGNMVSKIRTNGNALDRTGHRSTGAFGWFAGDFEAYFRDQDLGTPGRRGIPPAHAMAAATGVAQRVLDAEMARLFRST